MMAYETRIIGAAALTTANSHSAFAAAKCREPPIHTAGAHDALPQIS